MHARSLLHKNNNTCHLHAYNLICNFALRVWLVRALWINRSFDTVCGTLNKYAARNYYSGSTFSILHEYRQSIPEWRNRGRVCNRLSSGDRRVACTVNERRLQCEGHEKNFPASPLSNGTRCKSNPNTTTSRFPSRRLRQKVSGINKTSAPPMIKTATERERGEFWSQSRLHWATGLKKYFFSHSCSNINCILSMDNHGKRVDPLFCVCSTRRGLN